MLNRKKRKFSWIIASLALYFAGLAIYMFQDNRDPFWVNYFYTINGYLICASLACNFKETKTKREMSVIVFCFCFRLLLLVYFTFSAFVIKDHAWMDGNIVFWIILAISGFIGTLYGRYNGYEKH